VYAFTESPIHPAASTKLTPFGFITAKQRNHTNYLFCKNTQRYRILKKSIAVINCSGTHLHQILEA
jgi:hypothetical protein